MVFEHHTHFLRRTFSQQLLIRAERVRERHAPRRDRAEVELARLHQVQARIEVPLLRPAHVADRIIRPAPFVSRVVTARPVAARIPHGNFLLVSVLPEQVHLRVAHHHDTSSIPQHIDGLFRRRIVLRRRRQHHRIDPEAVRPGAHFISEILLTRDDKLLRAHSLRKGLPRQSEIDRHHPHAVRTQQRRDEQADQSLPRHQHALAHRRLKLAHRLERDRNNRRVSRLPVLDAFRHLRRQHVRHGDVLGVKRALRPADGHVVADAKTSVQRIDGFHHSRRAVAKRRRGFETITHLVERRFPAERLRRIENLAHLVRPRLGLLKQVHLRLLDLHLLRAHADHRMRHAHQHSAGRRRGRGHVLKFQPSVLILSDLFQSLSC